MEAGDVSAAHEALAQMRGRWPEAHEADEAEARLLFGLREDLPRACALSRAAMQNLPWSPSLLALAAELHRACDEPQTAARILAAGLARFPGAVELHRLRETRATAPAAP